MLLSSQKLPTISGYSITEQIYSSSQTIVYRGVRVKDQKPVVIKLMRIEYPTSQEIIKFRHQYFITQNLDVPGIIKSYSLENYGKSYALIMEFGGISLRDEMASWDSEKIRKKPDFLNYFLDIAIKIASALDQLHHYQIIHKDIKPDNILINPITKEVKITDFSIASILPREVQFITNPDVLEGTLAYISPEQTGRMNRGIDYRSDYYSLGVTYFELLTGELPFSNDNPLELIYSHISKQPPVDKIINYNPEIISNIICKLMAKNAEERYQSAFGLKHDLELCLKDLQNNKKIEFELATKDISDHFIIPEKLYGRETEVKELLAAFDRVINPPQHHLEKSEVTKGVELFLVKGYSGMGKTAVVNEIYIPVLREKGYFIQGKFNQLQRDIPFSGWVEALSSLIQHLLSENDTQIEQWKTNIISNLGDQAQVIVNLIPALEVIIGQQPKPAELSGVAAQNRLNFLFQKFINIFAIRKHPLVIFLDDLQWADAASLSLIQLLMSGNSTIKNLPIKQNKLGIQIPNFKPANINENDDALLLIGSYRDNEVSMTHPLYFTIGEIKKNKVRVSSINLEPLNQNELGILLAETLKCEIDSVISLTQAVFAKTKGNPFFIHQFLKTLYKNRAIKFNHKIGVWECDVADVRKLALTDDVVEFLALQIKRLPTYNQKLLKFAACIGNKFDLKTLSTMNETHPNDTITELWDSVLEGLVLPIDEIDLSNQDDATTALIIDSDRDNQISLGHCQASHFKFIHDRVQQAAYSLIPESEKQQIHLDLGKLLLDKTSAELWEKDIFGIVNQFNKALELIDAQQERNELAKMNLIAGRSAISATAYQQALKYLTTGRELLISDCWETEYELSLGLHEALAEITYLTGDFQASEEFVEVVLTQAKTLLEKVKVYEIRIQAYGAQGKAIEAVNTALKVLKQLGIEFPENPNQSDVEQTMGQMASNFAGREIEELADLPEMTEAEPLAAMRILSSAITLAYQVAPKLMPLFCIKQINLSLKYGNAPLSALAYIIYGLILCGIVGDIEAGYKFGNLAESLVNKFQGKEVSVKVLGTLSQHIKPWKFHIRNTFQPLQEIYFNGIEVGALEFAAYALNAYCYHAYFTGTELNSLTEKTNDFSNAIYKIKQNRIFNWNEIYRQNILNLQGYTNNICDLVGEAYNEKEMLPIHLKANDGIALIHLYLCKFHLCYLTGAYTKALENSAEAKKYLYAGVGMQVTPQFYLYDSLTRLALYPEITESEQQEFLKQVTANQEKMQHWANHAPMNFLHKFHLVEAEKNSVLDKKIEAMELFDLAISGAKENEYIHEEALANELAAKFYLKWGKQKIAKAYLDDAYYGYIRWGAKAKVKDLQQRYPQLLTHIPLNDKTDSRSEKHNPLSEAAPLPEISHNKSISCSNTTISAYLDFESVIKASQALSEQIKLDELLSTLMEVIMENAGASKCALILSKNTNLELTAISCNSNTSSISTELPSIPLESSNNVPVRLINYIKRTKESILVDDANTQNFLLTDSYIIREKPKSILCIPIINQSKLFGILYLENKLTAGVFTKNRIKLLNLIANQAAISLKNAILYNNLTEAKEELENYNQTLEEKVAERIQEIDDKSQRLKKALQDLQSTQSQLIQTEKMSSLGQMVAGIAHEINNPVNFIHGNINHASQYVQDLLDLITIYQQENTSSDSIVAKKASEIDLDFILEDLPKLLKSVEIGTSRIRQIILGLRNFSRLDEAEMKCVDIHEGIENTLMILQHRFKAKDNRPEIQVIKEYGQLPQINCYASQLNQVFMNILSNAIDALEDSQTKRKTNENLAIRIVTEIVNSNTARIKISDNGSGIEQKVQQKIFDPFFTTKPVGSGTGLGLSISYQIIVDKHKGQLICNSTVGEGTEFLIDIPMK
ncbi:protein kinase domain-containing protein [Rivularia sp. UHCC 0363]|uniref:protein kinase domain-containing protein n=1 Tax=Rivularia sp. UHCC 0363 TaxID=3110244 RepID=UPI002B21D884|nr:AAA family ATPase [Rivularia sp. UHCC 0363]MEA5594227.1 AAA family ATPase [Rivularia sp. UHCC 0363]